jgi:hypothetical protein
MDEQRLKYVYLYAQNPEAYFGSPCKTPSGI